MTGLQVVVNILLAVVAYLIVVWAISMVDGLDNAVAVIMGLVAAVVVFATNVAARLGVQ